MGFNYLPVANLTCTRGLKLRTYFEWQWKIHTLSGALQSLQQKSWDSSWQMEHCISANSILQYNSLGDIQVLMSKYETQLSYLWQRGSFCLHIIEIQVYLRILRISSWQIRHCILANPIWQSKQTRRYWVLVSEYETWANLFMAKPQHLLAYYWSSGTPLIDIPEASEAETALGYSWLKCSFHYRCYPGLWLKFMHNWHLQSSPE